MRSFKLFNCNNLGDFRS